MVHNGPSTFCCLFRYGPLWQCQIKAVQIPFSSSADIPKPVQRDNPSSVSWDLPPRKLPQLAHCDVEKQWVNPGPRASFLHATVALNCWGRGRGVGVGGFWMVTRIIQEKTAASLARLKSQYKWRWYHNGHKPGAHFCHLIHHVTLSVTTHSSFPIRKGWN